MKILHYTIGFQPDRTGGLVKYATDLIEAESRQGNDVVVLFPGTLGISQKFGIHHERTTSLRIGVECFSITASLPLPLAGGIRNPERFMRKVDEQVYHEFLTRNHIQIIHVHSLMGIHLELFRVANKLGIPIVFTTHDYFGLSTEPNLYLHGKSYDDQNNIAFWEKVAVQAPSVRRDLIYQLPGYHILRNIIKKMPKSKTEQDAEVTNSDQDLNTRLSEELKNLKRYYETMFKCIDYFIFNSEVTRNVFEKNLPFPLTGKVVQVTSKDAVKREIRIPAISTKTSLTIGYIGPSADYKGFFDFVKFANNSQSVNRQFKTYGYAPSLNLDGIEECGRFSRDEVKAVYSSLDVLVVPSRWKETFGLIVTEALTNGVRVFASDNVGAGELLPDFYRFESIEDLQNKFRSETLPKIEVVVPTFSDHVQKIETLYGIMIDGKIGPGF